MAFIGLYRLAIAHSISPEPASARHSLTRLDLLRPRLAVNTFLFSVFPIPKQFDCSCGMLAGRICNALASLSRS